jgi:hypothetical protein
MPALESFSVLCRDSVRRAPRRAGGPGRGPVTALPVVVSVLYRDDWSRGCQ